MIDRRKLVMMGAALLGPSRALAGAAGQRLETRLFNFRDTVSPEKTSEVIAALTDVARSPEVGGFLVGRNFIPDPFATRFEWLYMIQIAPADGGDLPPAYGRFQAIAAELSALCLDVLKDRLYTLTSAVAGTLGFYAAAVKVRHTVMFDFRPDASAGDQARNVDAIRNMGRLPMVQAYRVERSATYPSDASQMQWQVIGDFASVEDYRAYSNAPVHLAIRDDFKAHTSRVAFLDVKL